MIYRSNLTAPNVVQYFRYAHSRVQGHSFGHDVISDWSDKADDDPEFDIYKRCGFWTHDEAAILYTVAQSIGGHWLDIGAATGWTSAHLSQAGCTAVAVEPMLWRPEWHRRFSKNVGFEMKAGYIMPWAGRSGQLFSQLAGCQEPRFDGVVIDGDHNEPAPLIDACCADSRLKPGGVMLFHDLMGGPVQAAAVAMMDKGYQCKVFFTPHMVACCWRGEWKPPGHVPDPAIDWQEIRTNHMRDFPWERCV